MKLVSVETPEKSVCKMTFSASPEELEAASNAVYERTRASYTIRGFKKGEADRAQIEADRGEHTFWYDAINDLMDKDVPALYDAAMAEHGFVAVDNPVYDLVSVKKDEGFVATATVALQPELNLTKTTGFTAECVTPEVTDKEIDNVLERRRAAAAELVPHKGPAVKGNIVHIDYEGLLEGKPFQGGTAKNQAVQLGSGRMIPGFEEGILGHKAGEEFEVFVTFPNRYHAKDLAGKPVVFKIKLIDVCVRQIPALNSDFAKKVANVDTMDELRAQVKQQLHDGKHAGALNRAKDQILTQLADASEAHWEHTVSWIDCISGGGGRGVFMRGNPIVTAPRPLPTAQQRTMPLVSPVSLVNRLSLRPFNMAYYHLKKWRAGRAITHYEAFFYPLDNLLEWNRMYGPRGFFQYQSVVPRGVARDAVQSMLQEIEEREKEETGIKSLKIGYNKVFGYYIEVTHANSAAVPLNYVRKQTLANAERYITPELKDFEIKVLGAQEKIVALEYQLFCQIRDEIKAFIPDIQETSRQIAHCPDQCHAGGGRRGRWSGSASARSAGSLPCRHPGSPQG